MNQVKQLLKIVEDLNIRETTLLFTNTRIVNQVYKCSLG